MSKPQSNPNGSQALKRQALLGRQLEQQLEKIEGDRRARIEVYGNPEDPNIEIMRPEGKA